MKFKYKGVTYTTESVLHGESDHITCINDRESGQWNVIVHWKCKMGVRKYQDELLGNAMVKAAEARVEWGGRKKIESNDNQG